MDSCHLFNFLFGAKKATNELSKCFSNLASNGASRSRRQRKQSPIDAAAGDSEPEPSSPPQSPLRQLQSRIVSLTQGGGLSAVAKRGQSGRPLSGTYRATLVESLGAEENELPARGDDDGETCLQSVDSKKVQSVEIVDNPSHLESDGREDKQFAGCNSANAPLHETPIGACGEQQPKRVVLYGNDTDSGQLEACEIVASAEVYNVVSEFGQVRARLRRVGSITNDRDFNRPRGESHIEVKPSQQVKQSANLHQNNIQTASQTGQQANDKRSVFVRSLVQSIELNQSKAFESNSSPDFSPSKHKMRPKEINSTGGSAERAPILKPITFVKPMPPKTPPKTNKAKCLTMQLSLNKPATVQQLFEDEKFLARFFDKLEPLDRCVAAQVCRRWRNVLYANQHYWKDLVNVIDCTQLRREQIVECIMNTLQTAKLKHLQHQQQQQQQQQQLPPPPLMHHKQIEPSRTGKGVGLGPRQGQQVELAVSNGARLSDLYAADMNSASDDYLAELDQDDVWRIQELCNRFTQRSGQVSLRQNSNGIDCNNNHNTQTANGNPQEQTGCTASKSSSIPSQISSTFSSVSLSSLLSPLSDSNRIESIKEKIYTSIDDRGFDAICLFGANDEDIDDLVSKIPTSAHKRIVVGRLNNCCISNRGLETFVATFDSIREIELSGCNEITNSFDLRVLTHLKQLTITDCINIADGIAQRLVEIFPRLEGLIIQAYHLTDAFLDYLSVNTDTTCLRHLELPNCKEITNQSLLIIAKHFPKLEWLSISGSTKISDEGIEILAEQARQLKTLDLSWCSGITDASLECIACDLSDSLTNLILDRNVHITDVGLGYLATMHKLTLLHIRWCPRISDSGLESIITIKTLRHLSLAGLHQITARSLLYLVEANHLVEVELTNCPAVNRDLLRFLSERMPKCNIIF